VPSIVTGPVAAGPTMVVRLQPVVVARLQDRVAITAKGLTPGQVVVTDGHMRLSPGAEVTISAPKDASAPPPPGGAATGTSARTAP